MSSASHEPYEQCLKNRFNNDLNRRIIWFEPLLNYYSVNAWVFNEEIKLFLVILTILGWVSVSIRVFNKDMKVYLCAIILLVRGSGLF